MSAIINNFVDEASVALTIVICISGIAYVYFEIRNTWRKVEREGFFERVREKMREEAPDLRQRLITNLADYPKLAFDDSESKTPAEHHKHELIVASQILSDLDKLYIYSSINEMELQEFSAVLRERIVHMRIDIVDRQQLVSILERWYAHSIGQEREYLGQFGAVRKFGSEKKLLRVAKRKLAEERGEEFILKQRARIFESVRQIIQMTGSR